MKLLLVILAFEPLTDVAPPKLVATLFTRLLFEINAKSKDLFLSNR